METKIIKLDTEDLPEGCLKSAAEIIKSGGLVASPTETVYGLGANALDENASGKIYTCCHSGIRSRNLKSVGTCIITSCNIDASCV
jgi:tRNA A37 threonylcarbamoyladenosine synthetase subunit TsaC/SUA5/YrdC